MTSDGCAAVSWRARWRVLLTTPVRLRSKSRPSRATRGTTLRDCLIEDIGQVTGQDAAIEARDFSRVGVLCLAGAMLGKRLAQGASDGIRVTCRREPAAAGLGEDVGGRRVGRGDSQDR